jgi:hypothetical protein
MASTDVRTRIGLALALVLSSQCTPLSRSRASVSQAKEPAARREAERQLRAAFPEAQVEWDEAQGRVHRMRGLRGKAGGTAEAVGRSVLSAPAVAAALGLSPGLPELCRPSTYRDPQLADAAVVRWQQCLAGVRVLGAELVVNVRLGPSPIVDTITSSLSAGRPASLRPTIPLEAAVAAARRAAVRPAPDTPGRAIDPELVVFDPALFQDQGPSTLCWYVRVDALVVLVDATDGRVLKQFAAAQRGVR